MKSRRKTPSLPVPPGMGALVLEARGRCGTTLGDVRLETLAEACGVKSNTLYYWAKRLPVLDAPGVRLARQVLRGFVVLTSPPARPTPAQLRAWRADPVTLTLACLLEAPRFGDIKEELLEHELERRGQLVIPPLAGGDA